MQISRKIVDLSCIYMRYEPSITFNLEIVLVFHRTTFILHLPAIWHSCSHKISLLFACKVMITAANGYVTTVVLFS